MLLSAGLVGLIGTIAGIVGNIIVANVNKNKTLDQKVFDFMQVQDLRLKTQEERIAKQDQVIVSLQTDNYNTRREKTKLEIDILQLKHQNETLLCKLKELQDILQELKQRLGEE